MSMPTEPARGGERRLSDDIVKARDREEEPENREHNRIFREKRVNTRGCQGSKADGDGMVRSSQEGESIRLKTHRVPRTRCRLRKLVWPL